MELCNVSSSCRTYKYVLVSFTQAGALLKGVSFTQAGTLLKGDLSVISQFLLCIT